MTLGIELRCIPKIPQAGVAAGQESCGGKRSGELGDM